MESMHRDQGRNRAGAAEVTVSENLQAFFLQLESQCHPAPNEKPWLLLQGQLPDLSDMMDCVPPAEGMCRKKRRCYMRI